MQSRFTVFRQRSFRSLFPVVAVFMLALSPVISRDVLAAVRAGAPRPLQSEGEYISGTHVVCQKKSLVFARLENGINTPWRAVPQSGELTKKNLSWEVRALDISASFAATLEAQRVSSPNNVRCAFISRRTGMEAIYVAPENQWQNLGQARRVVTLARYPTWLDEKTLLFESARPGRRGLFRVEINSDGSTPASPQLLFSRGGETTVSPDGQTICLAALDEDDQTTQLYLLASDGSGARAVAQTLGARRPSFAPDGKAIFFDAPAPRDDVERNDVRRHDVKNDVVAVTSSRVLWMMPLTNTGPVAQLFFVREAKNGDAEIVGSLFSGVADTMQTTLEVWPGGENEAGKPLRVPMSLKNAPVQNGVLASWPVPRGNRGESQIWTLRLLASDASGRAVESTLTFRWPPEKAAPPFRATPPLLAAAPTNPVPIDNSTPPAIVPLPAESVTGQAKLAPAKSTPAKRPQAKPAQAKPAQTPSIPPRDRLKLVPVETVPPAMAILPSPPPGRPTILPPAARGAMVNSKTADAVRLAGTINALPDLPTPASPSATATRKPAEKPPLAKPPLAKPPLDIPVVKSPIESPSPPEIVLDASTTDRADPGETEANPALTSTPEWFLDEPVRLPMASAQSKKPEVPKGEGIPARMKVGTRVPVTVTLRNTGSRVWSSQGESPVRLITRWVHAESNIRHRWTIQWLREVVPPGKSTRVKFEVIAPPNPGRYILTYALVRLNSQNFDGKKYKPPPSKAKDHRWPGEFGTVSFEIAIVP